MNISRIRQIIQEEIKLLKEFQVGDGGDYSDDIKKNEPTKEMPKGDPVDKTKTKIEHGDNTEEYITLYSGAISDIVDTVIDKWHYQIKKSTPTIIDFQQKKYQLTTNATADKTVYEFPKDKLVNYAFDKIIKYTETFFKKFTVKEIDDGIQVTLPTGKKITVRVDKNSLIVDLPNIK